MTEKPSWLRFAVRVSSQDARDAVSAALFAGGAQGVQDDGDWLITHVESGAERARLENAIRAADRDASFEWAEIAPVDWSVAWRDRVGAHTLGAVTIAPPWLAGAFDPAMTIVIEPAMAFGTGEHATTRGVVRLMQGAVRRGDRVADLGAGSAVLAIAAAKLGAAWAAAIELDPDAISNAEENVVRNGVEGRVKVICGDAAVLLPLVAPVHVVLANIVSSVLADLLPTIARSLDADGIAILSGILIEERERMVGLLADAHWRIDAEDSEDAWWTVRVSR